MVIPLAFYSGALSILPYSTYLAWFFAARYLVMAEVRVVFPWSMWPMVPTKSERIFTIDVGLGSFELSEVVEEIGGKVEPFGYVISEHNNHN